MYFVDMLPVLYRPALFYLWVVVAYHGSCVSLYCFISVWGVHCVVLGVSGSLGGSFRGPFSYGFLQMASLCGVLPLI